MNIFWKDVSKMKMKVVAIIQIDDGELPPCPPPSTALMAGIFGPALRRLDNHFVMILKPRLWILKTIRWKLVDYCINDEFFSAA